MENGRDFVKKPDWLKIRLKAGCNNIKVEKLISGLTLHTVCEEAGCPNKMECFGRGTATFMILGRLCTRNCTFCNVEKGFPAPVDPDEPRRVAAAVRELRLKHAVVTSVTRDDLPDGGAGHFARVIREIAKLAPDTVIEVLIPDFKGDINALTAVALSGPDIINHNMETVPRLYPEVRPMADYARSLKLISDIKKISAGIVSKSGIMVGLGERFEEVTGVMDDLRSAGCDMLTIGQYLAPSRAHHPVVEYIHPNIFDAYSEEAARRRFLHVASAPLVRSSYRADDNMFAKKAKY